MSTGSGVKVTVTDLAAVMVTVQFVLETASHPVQPPNAEPAAADAARVTTVPWS